MDLRKREDGSHRCRSDPVSLSERKAEGGRGFAGITQRTNLWGNNLKSLLIGKGTTIKGEEKHQKAGRVRGRARGAMEGATQRKRDRNATEDVTLRSIKNKNPQLKRFEAGGGRPY